MPRCGIYCVQLRATQQAKAVAGRSSGCPHPCLLALNRSHAVGVGWGCTIPSGASRTLGHRPRAQPAPICCQESNHFGPATGFLLASARDLRFSPRAIQQGNVGLLGTQNGITRSAARRVKTPDLVLSYTDPVLMNHSRSNWKPMDAHDCPRFRTLEYVLGK